MMKYLQKLGKALMLPVACLPICGILMGIGYSIMVNDDKPSFRRNSYNINASNR